MTIRISISNRTLSDNSRVYDVQISDEASTPDKRYTQVYSTMNLPCVTQLDAAKLVKKFTKAIKKHTNEIVED